MRMIKATKLIKKDKTISQLLDDPGCSSPAASELVEELLVELLVALLASHRQEDVAADELVDHLAVRREALRQGGVSWVQDEGRSPHLEDHVLVVLKLDHHVPCLPVHVPRLVLGKSDVQFNFRLILLLYCCWEPSWWSSARS